MIYDVRHVTTYAYEAPVTSARLVLRLTPRDEAGQQAITRSVEIKPAATTSESRDFFGNGVTLVSIEERYRDLAITARARVLVDRPLPFAPGSGSAWETVVDEALSERQLGGDAPAHFLYASPRVALARDVTAYAAASFSPGRRALDAARDLMHRIRADFRYQPGATEIRTPVEIAFAQRRGVCQDFAHIMIAGLRGLGIPAGYASGYIRTIPPAGKPRLEGSDASHAWVRVWCGEELGWIGLDPTNGIDVGNDHILLANGRDYSDVSPIYGVFIGSGETELEVEVDVLPVEDTAMPATDAARLSV